MRIYVAGPYSAKKLDDVYINIAVARATAAGLWMAGHEAFCPHVASHDIYVEAHLCGFEIAYERWLAFDIGIIQAWAEAMYVIAESPGVLREIEAAKAKGIPVFRSMDEIPKATLACASGS